jgi:hypothetical protein
VSVAEKDELSKAEIIANSVERISDSKGVGEIGKGLGAGLVAIGGALAFTGVILAISFGSKWDGHLHPQERCFDFKEISGKSYKVNSCTGEISEIELKPK